MNISNPNNQYNMNNVAFGGNRLLSVPIQVRQSGFLNRIFKQSDIFAKEDTFFTQMTRDDLPLIPKLLQSFKGTKKGEELLKIMKRAVWIQDDAILRTSSISKRSADKEYFFMLESKSDNSPSGVKGLMRVIDSCDEDVLWVDLIQSAKKKRLFASDDIKGVGTALMYGVGRIAQALNKSRIGLFSEADTINFYKKLGMSNPVSDVFEVSSECYEPFLSGMEKRMNISRQQFLMEPKRNKC